MSKMYKVEEGIVLRNNEAIATYENGELDFFNGMAKYRIPVVKWLNKASLSPKPAKIDKKVDLKQENNDLSWIDHLSDIVGTKIPYPHRTNGWRGTRYRDLLVKSYNKILKSDALSDSEKRNICNQFI
mgnify:FL=1